MQVLHLAAHLGGGVGKALSGLIARANFLGSGVQHCIACLEKPEKNQFIELIRGQGGEVIICPSPDRLEQLILAADIVQLEWWNHPSTIKNLCSLSNPAIRLLTWSHTSGLYNPSIPNQLIRASHIFLFTSPCSLENKEVQILLPEFGDRLGVVFSSGGFSGLPEIHRKSSENLSVGYFGSLNFSKLHPGYIDYLARVELPGFRVKMIGDLTNQEALNRQCEDSGKTGILEFRGYSTDISDELAKINVLAYLLNPLHYGTTENALLEAMAMEIVPIVLDNPAERKIVTDQKTGLIIQSPDEFAQAIDWLSNHPEERQQIGTQAAKSVRERFSVEKMETDLNSYYRQIMSMGKKEIEFREIFGTDPAEWFLSCQGNKSIFADDGSIRFEDHSSPSFYGLIEKSKGTVFQFSNSFPDNLKLKMWADNLQLLQLSMLDPTSKYEENNNEQRRNG